MVLGKKKIEQYNSPPTHNCTSMLGCHHHHRSRKIPKSFCNKNKACKAIQISPVYLKYSEYEKKRYDKWC